VNGKVITESQVIMELLDEWHPESEGYKPMLPAKEDTAGWSKYDTLARLERELFSWWCTLVFRPDSGGGGGGGGGMFSNPFKKDAVTEEMSGAMRGFLDCIGKVDKALQSTKGPWFFGEYDYPTMIDFVYVSHVERMLASAAYWKGLNLRDPKWELKGINAWLEAFEKREAYVAFKSDYFTHVMDIPPQYGPGYDGGFESDRKAFSQSIIGRDGSWHLPLTFDDPVQPLYKGPPLPLCVLESMALAPDATGTYESADPAAMEKACRYMAAMKLSGNGSNVAKFAARGGPKGGKNIRKTFGAPLADPYADPDEKVKPSVDAALRVVCAALLDDESADNHKEAMLAAVPKDHADGVMSSLEYLRDRVGVPRDLPLASARYFRAYLNWGIDTLSA
jgi:glutathione S-transferase